MQERIFKKIVIIALFLLFFIPSTLALLKSFGSNSNGIKAAIWDVDLTPISVNNSLTVTADSSSTVSYTVSVTSDSEVDVDYSIVISNVPQGVSIQLDNTGPFEYGTNGTITFSPGSILYSDSTRTKAHTLTFKADTGTTALSNRQIAINVIFVQSNY